KINRRASQPSGYPPRGCNSSKTQNQSALKENVIPPAVQPKSAPCDQLTKDLLQSFDDVFGLHTGFRPVHAKGVICSGTFAATAEAKKLTRAPHVTLPSINVTVRFSDFTGIPDIP